MQSVFPAATAVVDLTPTRPVPMGGFSPPERLCRSTEGRLEANILALGEGSDTIVVVSLDALFVGVTVRDRILGACAERFGIGAEQVLLLASHTHFAPMLDTSKPLLGRADAEEVGRWAELISAAITSVEESEVATIRAGCGVTDLAVNRRLRWRLPSLVRLLGRAKGGVYMCDNPEGPHDPRVRTWTWLSKEGHPIAVLWTFACHPVFYPKTQTASAEYIGRVRDALRCSLGAQLPVIFAPGCMGDTWPRSPGPWNLLHRLPSFLIYGPSPLPYDEEHWEQWVRCVTDKVLAVESSGTARPMAAESGAARMEKLGMDEIFEGVSPVPELTAKSIRLPGVGRIVALSCEPVADIAEVFAEDAEDLILGYEGDVFGYLPTDALIVEGGYESCRFMDAFGLRGTFRSQLDSRIERMSAALRS